jgi:hypothetical protein
MLKYAVESINLLRVQLYGLVVVPDVECVCRDQVVSLEHLHVVHLEASAQPVTRGGTDHGAGAGGAEQE